MKSTDIMIEVTSAVDIGEPAHIAATLHLPEEMPSGQLDLIFAVHGGGYNRHYWHPHFADDSYSFARFFTGHGKAVLAIDMLGMGQSSTPEPESRLDRMKIAAAHNAALVHCVAELARPVSITGLGHSMGGLSALMLAQRHPEAVGRVMAVDNLPFFSALFGPQVTAETARDCIAAGADVLVAGTAVFGKPDYRAAIAAIRGG